MTHTSEKKQHLTAAWGAGVCALALCCAPPARAQQPVLSAEARVVTRPSGAAREAFLRSAEPAQAAANGAAPLKDDLFAGTEKFAKGASDVTEVTMDPDSLDLVGGSEAHRAHRMVLNVVRTYTYDKPGMYNPADVEEYRRKLETGDWHCSVHIRDLKSGDSTDVCSKRRAPDMVENAIITVSPKSLTFIHNIRKANGQGGNVDWGGLDAFYTELPPNLAMAMINPEWAAEILAETAQLRANMPEMRKQLNELKLDVPKLDSKQIREEMQRAMQSLRSGEQIMREQPQKTPPPPAPASPGPSRP